MLFNQRSCQLLCQLWSIPHRHFSRPVMSLMCECKLDAFKTTLNIFVVYNIYMFEIITKFFIVLLICVLLMLTLLTKRLL